jgi:hypothetical protein
LSQRALLIAGIAMIAAGFLLGSVVAPLAGGDFGPAASVQQPAPAPNHPGMRPGAPGFGPGFGGGHFGPRRPRPEPSPSGSPAL